MLNCLYNGDFTVGLCSGGNIFYSLSSRDSSDPPQARHFKG